MTMTMTSGNRPITILALIIGLVWTASPARSGNAPELQFDPFRSPPAESPTERDPAGRQSSRDTFSPILRSTVVGNDRALVDLGGEFLAIGEESHGYRLIAVGKFEAVFSKDGKRVRLEVSSDHEMRR